MLIFFEVDIFFKLLQEWIVCFNGVIDDIVLVLIVVQFFWFELDNFDKLIMMYINLFGGEVSFGLVIYDIMIYIKFLVLIVCVGGVVFMVVIFLIGGELGKRYVFLYSFIMVY